MKMRPSPPIDAKLQSGGLTPNVAYFRKPVGHGDMVSVLEHRSPTARDNNWRVLPDAQYGSTRFTSSRALPRIGSVTIYFRGASTLAGFDTLLEARNAAGNTILIRKVLDVGGDNVMDFRTIGNHDVCQIQEAGLTQDPKPHWVTYTWNQTGVAAFNHVYLDGVLRDSVATSSSFTEGSPFDTIDLGNSFGFGNRWDAPSNDFMWHDWQLSEDEVRSLHRNPWQVFKPQLRLVPTYPYDPTKVVAAEAPAGNTLTITLVDAAGTPLTGLTGLSWAWFDESDVSLASTPTATGTGATTDGSGVFSVDITGTTLTSGQTGMLTLMDSTGYTYALYKVQLT